MHWPNCLIGKGLAETNMSLYFPGMWRHKIMPQSVNGITACKNSVLHDVHPFFKRNTTIPNKFRNLLSYLILGHHPHLNPEYPENYPENLENPEIQNIRKTQNIQNIRNLQKIENIRKIQNIQKTQNIRNIWKILKTRNIRKVDLLILGILE